MTGPLRPPGFRLPASVALAHRTPPTGGVWHARMTARSDEIESHESSHLHWAVGCGQERIIDGRRRVQASEAVPEPTGGTPGRYLRNAARVRCPPSES